MIKSIAATDFAELVASGKVADVVDVRTPAEFREIHITIARNEPLDRLDPLAIHSARSSVSRDPLYIVCRSGSRGKQACDKFIAAGIPNVVNVEGGTLACVSAGMPVVRGKRAIPLNCQVQIITGLTVMVGSILALVTPNPYWLLLPIVMGAGLTFSGITDTCAMGAILARMPWNQVKTTSTPNVKTATDSCCK